MVESSTLLTLPQLVDVTLNLQEGVVNFHTLYALLHIIVLQTGLDDINVEFRGANSAKVQSLIKGLKHPKAGQAFLEYTIQGGKKKRYIKQKTVSLQDIKNIAKSEEKREKEVQMNRRRNGSKEERAKINEKQKMEWEVRERRKNSKEELRGTETRLGSKEDLTKAKEKREFRITEKAELAKIEEQREEELQVIERRKNSKEEPSMTPLPFREPSDSQMDLREESTVVLVESDSTLPRFSIAVSKAEFEDMQDEIISLKTKIQELTELPGNMGLIQATIKTPSSPILDMFQVLNLTKRLEAAEEAMVKFGTIIEDLVRTGEGTPDLFNKLKEVPRSSLEEKISLGSEIQTRLELLEKFMDDVTSRSEIGENQSEAQSAATLSVNISEPTAHSNAIKTRFISHVQGIRLNDLPVDDALDLIQQEFAHISIWINSHSVEIEKLKDAKSESVSVNVGALESKFSESARQIEDLEKIYSEQFRSLTGQHEHLQREMNEIVILVDNMLARRDSTGITEETTMELANKLGLLEKEIGAINAAAKRVEGEKAERDKHIEAIMEEVDILKIVKANKQDIEDALEDKADACQINRKVSHDQLDAACDDLSRGIEEALIKFEKQEEMWNQALETIQKEVSNKLDRIEVDPLRISVNNKLKTLQEKFKSFADLQREHEAAGTKSKILREVNCISCDKDVIMRKKLDFTHKPMPFAMPPNRNMAPHLAYKLDQLRKQRLSGSKNSNLFKITIRPRSTKKDHLCSRYCGGSHTMITPQQRVTKMGNFLEQWSPEVAPLYDDYIRGNDNHMLKAKDEVNSKKSVPVGEKATLIVKESIKIGKEETISRNEVLQQDHKTQETFNDKNHSVGDPGNWIERKTKLHPEIAEGVTLQQRSGLVKPQSLETTLKAQQSSDIYTHH